MMREKHYSGKTENNKIQMYPKTLANYKSNNTEKIKSPSLNKYTVSIDKEQILKEFYLYKLCSSNSTNKSNKNKCNKSFTKSSKSKSSKDRILIPARSAKDVKHIQSQGKKYNTLDNKMQNNNRKQELKSYDDLLKEIESYQENKNTHRTNYETNKTSNVENNKINFKKVDVLDLLKPQVFQSKNNNALKNNDNNIPNIENLVKFKNLNYEKDINDHKNNNLKTNHDNNTSDYYGISNNHILNIRNSNGNFEKYKTYLNEKISYLKNKIEEDLVKRDKLITMLDQQNSEEQIENVKKLENEIKNFKKIKQNCLTTFSQLTDEINELKKEIAKHSEKINYDLNNFTSEKDNRLRKINFVSPKKLYQK